MTDQPSLMSALPDRTSLVIGQPRCVLCRALIDVWHSSSAMIAGCFRSGSSPVGYRARCA